jgi:hypothetical protein
MAQVYSINAVGFVTVDIPAGFWIISNPLKATSNKVSDLFKGVPDGFTVYKYNNGYSVNGVEFGEFANPNETLAPGEGAFVRNPGTTPLKVVFVGEVSTGNLSHAIPAGLSIQSSEVPQAGVLDTDLKFPAADGDVVYRYRRTNAGGNPDGYSIHSFEFGEWSPVPNIEVGEGFFVKKTAATNWTRTFNVNQ